MRRAALLLLPYAIALWARWRGLPVAVVLGDSMGPWWRALGDPLRPHAPPYGAALNLPYALILRGAGSLWEAVSALLALHALVAPIAVLLVLRLRPHAHGAALLAGLAAALDPGLVDTALSGCEGYLGALFVGLSLLAALADRPLAAGLAVGFAFANHPLGAVAGLYLLLLPPKRAAAAGLLALALAAPQLLRFAGPDQPDLSANLAAGPGALAAYAQQGGPGAVLVAMGLLLGLSQAPLRKVALPTLLGLGLLLLVGGASGALRDHHLRLLSLPALAGLAGLPGALPLLVGALCLRLGADPVSQPAAARRPGSLGLLTQISTTLPPAPLRLVDGAWLSGTPAAEPGAVLLDLHLRGAAALDLGGPITIILSAERADLARLSTPGTLRLAGDRYRVFEATEDELRDWSATLPPARLGGALDGWGALHPEADPAAIGRWWAPP